MAGGHVFVSSLNLLVISLLMLCTECCAHENVTGQETLVCVRSLQVCDLNENKENLAGHSNASTCHVGDCEPDCIISCRVSSHVEQGIAFSAVSDVVVEIITSNYLKETAFSRLRNLEICVYLSGFGFVRFSERSLICIRLHTFPHWDYTHKRYLRRRLNYSSNNVATFNPPIVSLILLRCGDVETQPGPVREQTSTESGCYSRKNERKIKVGHLNVRSLKNRIHHTLVKETVLLHKFDIFTISESWLDNTVSDTKLDILGYALYRQDRQISKGGGVCVFVKNNIKVSLLPDISAINNGFQQLWLQVQLNKCKSLVLCVAYRPPNSLPSLLTDYFMPNVILAMSKCKDLIVLGDLNCDMLQESKRETRVLLEVCSNLNLHQIITAPTRITDNTQTLIDVIITSNRNLISSSDVLLSSISDHSLPYAVLNLKSPRCKPTYVTVRSFKTYSKELFVNDLSLVPWHIVDTFDDVNDKLDVFNKLFMDVLDVHAPVKRIKLKSRPNPFVTSEIRALMKTRDTWHRKAVRSNDNRDWNGYRFFRQEVKKELRAAEKEYVRSELTSNSGNSRSLWKTINKCLPRKSCSSTHELNSVKLANTFNEYFTSLGSSIAAETCGIATDFNLEATCPQRSATPPETQFCFREVSETEVANVVYIPANKAAGPDKLPARVIKDGLFVILSTITSMINCSFTTSNFPQEWKIAEVIPIPKLGDKELACNNRPISLLPVMSKICERLAHGQYNNFLCSEGKLSVHQNGNRKLHSTETALLKVTDDILKAMDEKLITIMVLIDFSKAFDSINHETLLNKLWNIGMAPSALKWFSSYLTNISQKVRLGESLSQRLPLSHGVPQGSILGPLMFTVYVNDLPSSVVNCKPECYVDDSKLYVSFVLNDLFSAIGQINKDLDQLCSWCCGNSLLINPEKTKVLAFGTRQRLQQLPGFSIKLLSKQIEPTRVAKDLGVHLDSCLSYTHHVDKTVSSCMYSLFQINRVKHLLDRKTLLLVIHSLVFSRLFYCSSVWSNTSKENVKKLQLVQNFAARIVVGLRKYDHVSPALKELKWLNITDQLYLRDAVLVFKSLHHLTPYYLSEKFKRNSEVHSRVTRNVNDLHLPLCRLVTGQRTFSFRGAKLWNSLPPEIKSEQTLKSFKHKLHKHFLTS